MNSLVPDYDDDSEEDNIDGGDNNNNDDTMVGEAAGSGDVRTGC